MGQEIEQSTVQACGVSTQLVQNFVGIFDFM
uniref:Uncharacterized protein n=1 Tax=Rhizophora mucronata TaxID=61149 RepID=A0A2P2P5U4_RHIMU